MPWKNSPLEIQHRGDEDYYLFIDESGEHILKNFDTTRPIFTVAGVLIEASSYNQIKEKINNLKLKYWENGVYQEKGKTKKVCFINRAIRRRQKAFSKHYLNDEEYNNFILDLSDTMEELDFQIISSCIDKTKLVNQYINPAEPYSLAMMFIIERFAKFLHNKNKKGLVMLEARGKKEDGLLLSELLDIYNYGTRYMSYRTIQKRITGFYFNKKWYDNNQKTYLGLELADLIAHPIGHFALYNEKTKAFNRFETKFLGYKDYIGKGLKIFP